MSARQPFEAISQPIADQSLGAIAVSLPGATAVFRALKLDFCCHGNVSLRQAAQDKQLDLAAIEGQLAALHQRDEVAAEMSATEMVDHILTRYHDVHRQQLPELIRMAHRVETVHHSNPHVPAGLAEFLEAISQELLDHMAKEESILFPLVKAGGHAAIAQTMGVMRTEHIQHGAMLDRLNALTNDATPPPGACNTWRALYTGIAQFGEDLVNHIHLENNVLFPAFENAAPAPKVTGCGGGGGGCGCQ